ncbi:hypothetical protein OUQ99_17755 [Streptomonospora nanhaiensis]|uniref:Transmembrane protein n=1 Tax=Streptomonospora nanhaiensis TaxID=1323731 RepID=A0ABY6YFT4_9ACTN|nr:hypothetical protein [Streptomonospora nanhaiensis]WAE71080.1 hypothetical protein OUQ99_17755 [Streptomonospora nanhaiensis]
MAYTEPAAFLDRHPWLAFPLWVLGVLVLGGGAFVLVMGAYMATANGAHPWDGPLLSIALYLLHAALPVSFLYMMLVLKGRRTRRGTRIVGTLLLALVCVMFAAVMTSAALEPL